MLSRMEALGSTEQPGDSRTLANPGQGENATSLAGKDGTVWKQEVVMDPPPRTAPPPITSNQAVPAHAAQAGTGATFRVLQDAVHMRIQDEELGPMRWHIHLSGGRITAEAIVETARVQELLQNHQDVLEAKLNAMGVEVEGFDVSVGEGSERFEASSDPEDSGRSDSSEEDAFQERSMHTGPWNHQQGQRLDLYV
jgi:flagellar hook-length control protein FliK